MGDITQEQWEELNEKYSRLREEYDRLRENEELYRVSVGLTDHTISFVDIQKHTLNQVYNEGSWTGISVAMEDAPESIIATGIIHPEDCEGYREFYRRIYAGEPKGQYTMRTMEENRGWVWFTMTYQTVFDEDGTPLRAICFSDDITAKKNSEEQYRQFRASVTADAEYVWEINLTRDILISGDKNLDEIFDYSQIESYSQIHDIAMEMIQDPVEREHADAVFSRELLMKNFNKAKREVSAEYRIDFNDGRGCRWNRSVAYLMTDLQSDVIAILCTNDITEIRMKQELLENQAERDSLTGLYNRNAFEYYVKTELMQDPDRQHAFFMIDVDDFKHFNDTYGHDYGDTVLCAVADVLQSSFRAEDRVGRFGGDEFMVFVTTATDIHMVSRRAEDLQKELDKVCESEQFAGRITLSIGVSVSHKGDDYKSISMRADKALYESKKNGKNRYTVEYA